MALFNNIGTDSRKSDLSMKLLIEKLDDIRKAIVGVRQPIKRRADGTTQSIFNNTTNQITEETQTPTPQQPKENVKASPLMDILENDKQISKYNLLQLAILEQQLNIQEKQLTKLEGIQDLLSPRTPGELPETLATRPSLIPDVTPTASGSGLPSMLPSAGTVGGAAPSTKKKRTRGDKSPQIKSKSGVGGAIGKAAFFGAGALAAGAIATSGVISAEKEKSIEIQRIQEAVKSGEISSAEGETLVQKVIKETDISNKGAIGSGVGLFAGQIAGAKVGAAVGSVLGPVGAAVGGIVGGVTGAIAGTQAGEYLGRESDKVITKVKEFLGVKDKTEKIDNRTFNEKIFKKNNPTKYTEYIEFKQERFKQLIKEIPKELQNEPQEIQNALNIASKEAKEKYIVVADAAAKADDGKAIKVESKRSRRKREEREAQLSPKSDDRVSGESNGPSKSVEQNVSPNRSEMDSIIQPKKDVNAIGRVMAKTDPNDRMVTDIVNRTSVENNDLVRETNITNSTGGQALVSTNISNNETTNFVPIKPSPRMNDNSSLGRYQNKITAY